ncbi:DUF2516 family protein [Rothia sp. CCM 9417]|uniref:DUF2516 family protein n=1 Tax=unclassified Rothia (in: high G+C Gram-positive bacteria) TaxID=2689056 RepID=UPI003AC11D12
MTPLDLIAWANYLINLLASLVVAGLSVYALFEAARATGYAYQSAFKRTKGFWLAVTGAATLFSVLTLWQSWNGRISSIFMQLVAATAVGVFLADVRPAVAVRRRR